MCDGRSDFDGLWEDEEGTLVTIKGSTMHGPDGTLELIFEGVSALATCAELGGMGLRAELAESGLVWSDGAVWLRRETGELVAPVEGDFLAQSDPEMVRRLVEQPSDEGESEERLLSKSMERLVADDAPVRLVVSAMTGDVLADFELPPMAIVAAVKEGVCKMMGMPIWEQRLVLSSGGGGVLDDDHCLRQLLPDKVQSGEPLRLTVVRVAQHVAISWSSDRTLKLWNLSSGTQIHEFGGPVGSTQLRGLSVDWRRHRALSWSGERLLRLWDVKRGTLLECLRGHSAEVLGAEADWSRSRALSWDAQGSFRVWDLLTQRHTELCHPIGIQGVRVGWEHDRAISWGFDYAIIWDLERAQALGALWDIPGIRLCSVAPNWASALIGCAGTSMQLWDLQELTIVQLSHHLLGIPDVEMDWVGMRGLSWSCDGTLRLWGLGQSCSTAWAQGVVAVHVNWRGNRALTWTLVSGGLLKPQLWDLGCPDSPLLRPIWSADGCICMLGTGIGVRVDWDSQRALSWSDDSLTPRLWDIAQGCVVFELEGHTTDGVNGLEVDWVRDRAITWSAGDTSLRLWDLSSGTQLHEMIRVPNGEFGVHVDWNRNRALSWTEASWGNCEFTLELWDLETGQELHVFGGHADVVLSALVSPEVPAGELPAPEVLPPTLAMAPEAPINGTTVEGGKLLASFVAGELDSLVAEYRGLMRAMPRGPPQRMFTAGQFRVSGEGPPYGPEYVPVEDAGDRAKLLMLGDSITMGAPQTNSTPVASAVARMNDAVLVENAGWGGLLSMMLARPREFDTASGTLPLPEPRDFHCDFAVILIGTMDSIALAGTDTVTEIQFVTKAEGWVARLPKDWKSRCRPSLELFESSLQAVVRALMANGARVAIATPPPLGEQLEDVPSSDRRIRRAPFAVVSELAAAVRRVALAESCEVLPLFECCLHRLRQLAHSGRQPVPWAPRVFWDLMMRSLAAGCQDSSIPWEDMVVNPDVRPALCHDLVKLNESGGAIYAALLQAWLDVQLLTRGLR